MIIELFLTGIYRLFSSLTSFINIPNYPDSIDSYLQSATMLMKTGVEILNNYLPMSYFLTLFGIIVAIDIAIKMYHLVMWILRKIPMAGIS